MVVASSKSSASQRSELSILAERISVSDLERLACRHAKSDTVTVQIPPLRGSYNLVYPLTFSDGRKWVARIPDPSSFNRPAMQSTMDALRLISERTTIPIPSIHAYDTSSDNELGMPYELLDFIDGVPLSRIWKDENIVDDAARRRIFEQVAGYMSQLGAIQFDKIGRLQYDEASGIYSVGPYRSEPSGLPGNSTSVTETGPFTTTHAFLSHLVQNLLYSPRQYAPVFSVMRLLALSLPDPRYDGAPFVLSPPDFDSQNVLVNPKTLTVMAFIDWDGVSVGPRLGGFARYPAWITRDWDPCLYNWREPQPKAENDNEESGDADAQESHPDASHSREPQPKAENDNEESGDADAQESHPDASHSTGSSASMSDEESPETLQGHRDLYLSIYSAIDPENADITRHSHVFEAIEIALNSPEIANDIMLKLCSHAFNADREFAMKILLGVSLGDWYKGLDIQEDINA